MKILDVVNPVIEKEESSSVFFWVIVAVLFVLCVCLFFALRYWRKHNRRKY